MKDNNGKILVIGAGITGLTAADRLSARFGGRVLVVEKESAAGGLASTLTRDNLHFDLGSHRLHPDMAPGARGYITELVGKDLLERKRRGKLYFRGKYINYPPDILNFIRMFSLGELAKFTKGFIRSRSAVAATGSDFESVMTRKYGKEAYETFYRDYAWKIWGRDPKDIEIEGIKRLKITPDYSSLSKALSLKSHRFFYPRHGIGEIAEKLENRIIANGAAIMKNSRITSLNKSENTISGAVVTGADGEKTDIPASVVVSTIPIDGLYPLLSGGDNEGRTLEWRGARFLYMLFDAPMAGESETYYFPNRDVQFGRVSEIKKYSPDLNASENGSLLTVEIPSTPGDAVWKMPDSELLDISLKGMMNTGIITPRHELKKHFVIDMDKIYPIYLRGWKETFERLYGAVNGYENIFSIGRGGLFLHINIDHCVTQGQELADHIINGATGGKRQWQETAGRYFEFSARD